MLDPGKPVVQNCPFSGGASKRFENQVGNDPRKWSNFNTHLDEMPKKPESSENMVLPIQYLRGIAAMMVVYHHTRGQVSAFEEFLKGSFGALGVDIFFVISGFIMFITTASRPIGASEFMVRRIIRIVPLYWLLTGSMCLIWMLNPSIFKTLLVTPYSLFQSLFFIPHYSNSFPGEIFPLLVPGWTLNYEMFFYSVLSLALILPRALLLKVVFVLIVGLVILGEVAGSFHSAIWVTYTRPLLLEFVTGMVLGKLWFEHKHGLSFRAGVAVFAMGLAVLIANGMLAESLYLKTLGATLIVAGCLNEKLLNWKNPYLKIVGDSTYAIYLSHLFTLGLLRAAWVWTFGSEGTHLNAISFAVAGLGSSLLGGMLLYAYLEAPVTRYLNRLYASKRTFKAS